MDEESSARRLRATWIAALLLLAAAALAVALRAPLAARLARAWLASRGVPASLAVSQLGWGGARLEDLRVGAPDAPALAAQRVELAWSLAGLRAGRLGRISAEGVRLAASLDAEGLRLRGFARARGGEGGDARSATTPLGLRFESAELRDFELRLETPEGPVALAGGGEFELAERIAGELRLSGATPYGGIEATLSLSGTAEAPQASFEASARPEPGALPIRLDSELRAKGALRRDEGGVPRWELALALPWLELAGRARLEQITLDAEGGDAELRAQLRVARLVEASEPPLVAPLGIEAELRGPFERLALTGTARPPGDGVRCEIRGVIEPLARRAELELRVPEADLGPEALPAARLFPFLAGRIERAQGRLGAKGRARLEAGRLDLSVDVALRDLDLRTPAFTLRRLNGVVNVQGPPLRTPAGQLLSVAAIEGPLPLADGIVVFDLSAEGVLRIERASFGMAKGRLLASGELPIASERRTLLVAAEGLDVETILASLGFEGLSGTGTLAGALPLRQQGTRVRIDGGRLRATAPGVLRYRADAGSAAAAERQGRLGIAIGALEDLHYDELELELSGDTAEELSVKVHVRGSNPRFQQGRRVVLNLDVQARLADLVKAGQSAYRVPGEVEERVERVLDPERR